MRILNQGVKRPFLTEEQRGEEESDFVPSFAIRGNKTWEERKKS